MKIETLILAGALDVLANEIQSGDGIANAAIAEAADRLRSLEVEVGKLSVKLRDSETQRGINHERAEEIIKAREQRIEALSEEVEERRRDAQKDAAIVGRLRRALVDAISTYDPNRKETLVTAERQEAWIAALREGTK